MRKALLLAALVFLEYGGLTAEPADELPIPAFSDFKKKFQTSEALYLDRRGRILLEARRDNESRRMNWTPLQRISPALIRAVIHSEDRRFYSHAGADAFAFLGAFSDRILHGSRRGASTITMQLVSRLDVTLAPGPGGRSYRQKIRQIFRARSLEEKWSKDEILEAYLNVIPFRGDLEGIAAASYGLYGKDPHGLTDFESVILAAMIRSPQADRDDAQRRACMLAYSMKLPADCSTLQPDLDRAFSGSRWIRPLAAHAPHLLAWIPPQQEVRTTLDLDVQLNAREILHRHLMSVRNRNVRDGAVLVLDNNSGDVLAYVGSSGDLSAAPLVDSVRARRQAGSALKPFVYAAALDKKLITASTLLDDTPMNMPVFSGIYHPENYDREYFGPIPARIALASSRNIPAVRLLSMVGVDTVLNSFRAMRFAELRDADYYGPSLALGSLDVTLWQLTGAYRMLALGGLWDEPSALRDRTASEPVRIFSPQTAFIVADILSDRESRSLTFGFENVLSTPFWSAVKTGTSKDMRDNWCVGFTDRFTVGVWVGNASGEPMWNVLGVTGAAPVWLEMMRYLHSDSPSNPPKAPERIVVGKTTYGQDYYIEGTEPVSGLPLQKEQSRIVYPESGSVFALDPEIPTARQFIFFRAASSQDMQWLLDGKLLGRKQVVRWAPTRGSHRLTLQRCSGVCKDVETVQFLVR